MRANEMAGRCVCGKKLLDRDAWRCGACARADVARRANAGIEGVQRYRRDGETERDFVARLESQCPQCRAMLDRAGRLGLPGVRVDEPLHAAGVAPRTRRAAPSWMRVRVREGRVAALPAGAGGDGPGGPPPRHRPRRRAGQPPFGTTTPVFSQGQRAWMGRIGKPGKIARGAAFGFTLLKRYVSNRCIEGRWQFAG